MKKFTFILVYLSITLMGFAQNDYAERYNNYVERYIKRQEQALSKTNTAKLDLGLGFGAAGTGAGLSGRIALGFNIHNWGATVRSMVANGKTGKYIDSWLFGGGYYLREGFFENAVLLDHVVKHFDKSQLSTGIGISTVRGNWLNDDGSSEIEFDKVYGFAFEVSLATIGKVAGTSAQVYGNINKEAIFVGVSWCLTLGVWWE